MLRKVLLLSLLAVACFAYTAAALSLESKHTSIVRKDVRLLPRVAQLGNASFCFFTESAKKELKSDTLQTHCSFDGGKTVKDVKTSHSVCTSGVAIEQRLVCPQEQLPHDEDGELEYSASTFEVNDGELEEENSEKHFLFKGDKQTGELRQLLFNGNAIRVEDDEEGHILVSTIINDAEERKAVVFRSEDGFSFKAIAVIPKLEEAEAHYLLHEGGRRLVVVSTFNATYHTSVSSGYLGKFWSAVRVLNATTSPTSATFPSGIMAQYSCSNETSQTAKWYVVDGDSAKRAIVSKLPSIVSPSSSAGGASSLLFPVTSADNSKDIVVVQDEAGAHEETAVRLSVFRVDDSAEAKERADRIAKEREEVLKREAARFKAKMERLEREKAQRREQRRKEAERKQKFMTEDEPNVRAAKAFMEADGEMILVRPVSKESISLEKEVFFSDL